MKFNVYQDIDPDELAEILQRQDPDDPNDLINDRRRLSSNTGVNTLSRSCAPLQIPRAWVGRNSFMNDNETFLIATGFQRLEGVSLRMTPPMSNRAMPSRQR